MKTDSGAAPQRHDAACSGRCIALIEDNPADTQMIRFALREVNPAIDLVAFEGGVEALQYFAAAKVNDTFMPCDLLLVDLNLPALNGLEVLERIRANDHLRMLPVVILSGSSNPNDIERCYKPARTPMLRSLLIWRISWRSCSGL